MSRCNRMKLSLLILPNIQYYATVSRALVGGGVWKGGGGGVGRLCHVGRSLRHGGSVTVPQSTCSVTLSSTPPPTSSRTQRDRQKMIQNKYSAGGVVLLLRAMSLPFLQRDFGHHHRGQKLEAFWPELMGLNFFIFLAPGQRQYGENTLHIL